MVGSAFFLSLAEQGIKYLLNDFFPTLWERFLMLVLGPLANKEMLWIVAPLTTAIILMELYFGRYENEELGWNTAVGNSLLLVFVSLDLFRFLFGGLRDSAITHMLYLEIKVIIASLVALQGVILLYENFFHKLPKKWSFFISSTLPVNLTAFVAIVLIYTNTPIDGYTILAAVLLFLVAEAVFTLIHQSQHFQKLKAKAKKIKPFNLDLDQPSSS